MHTYKCATLVEGLNKSSLRLPPVLFASFLMNFVFIMKLSVFSIMNSNELVIGVSSVDSSTMNLGKTV